MEINVPDRELMYSGHVGCPGCGPSIAMRFLLKALAAKTMMVLPACCWSVIAGPYTQSTLKIPVLHTAFETGGAVASGVRAALDIQGRKDITVVTWAGDGGTFDIGFQALSGAAERNEDLIYVCYDNEAYMNTGIQRSSATPYGAWTTTTPVKHFKNRPKKDIVAIMAAHRIPYIATGSVSHPEDLFKKFKKAKDIKGTRFFHVYAPCPTGWKSRPEDTVKLARMAVQNGYFPLYEIENGEKTTLNLKIKDRKPVDDYLRLQGRFRHLTPEQVAAVQAEVDERWARLMKGCAA